MLFLQSNYSKDNAAECVKLEVLCKHECYIFNQINQKAMPLVQSIKKQTFAPFVWHCYTLYFQTGHFNAVDM